MVTTPLPRPLFPQMGNDGVINQLELDTSGIIIEVAEYGTAKKGDYIELWFESVAINSISLAEDNIDQYFPWICRVSPEIASKIQDGIYKVQYKVIDAAQNHTWSDTGNAIIDRETIGTFPPPIFPEADAENIISYDDAMSDGGTPVSIPAYPGIAIGDRVTLYWVGYINNDISQQSITQINHNVQHDELFGFDVYVSTPFILVEGLDRAKAWYVVSKNESRNERSKDGSVFIDATGNIGLPEPSFIEGDDGWLDIYEATSNSGTPIAVPVYSGMNLNDTVVIHWQGYNKDGGLITETKHDIIKCVNENDLADGFQVNIPTMKIIPIEVGTAFCYYDVFYVDGTSGSSSGASIKIDTIHKVLPPPYLTEAINDGVIDNEDAISEGGTPVDISYETIEEGDNVTLYWSGYQGNNLTPSIGSVYSITRIVSLTESQLGIISFTVPTSYIISIGKGYATASYTVQFANGGMAKSEDAVVDIDTFGGDFDGSNFLGGTTGFSPWGNIVIQNCSVQYLAMENGLPLRNVDVLFRIYGNNYFTINNLKEITLKTDIQGYVRTNISGSDTSINTITAKIIGVDNAFSSIAMETERSSVQAVPFLISEPYSQKSGVRSFVLSVSQDSATVRLSASNNSSIYIDGVNHGGEVDELTVYSSHPIYFYLKYNQMHPTDLSVFEHGSNTKKYCSFYF